MYISSVNHIATTTIITTTIITITTITTTMTTTTTTTTTTIITTRERSPRGTVGEMHVFSNLHVQPSA